LLVSLVLLVLWLRVFPGAVMDKVSPSVNKLITDYNAKLEAAAVLQAPAEAGLETGEGAVKE
jgi:hypothetical protein